MPRVPFHVFAAHAMARYSGRLTLFDALLSTDANHTYKPDPRAYQLGVDRLKLERRDIVFAAFGGWDAAGAKSSESAQIGDGPIWMRAQLLWWLVQSVHPHGRIASGEYFALAW